MYLYLITNNKNQKKYIGITNNYKKRWGNECSYPSDPERRQVIQEAIHKYGKNNFTFEILERGLSIEEAIEKEEKLIAQYHTWLGDPKCWGYNAGKGGRYHPSYSPQPGEKNGRAKITDEEAQYILDHRDQPLYVLYEEFNTKISYSEFCDIYHGRKFKHLQTTTPIYPYNFNFSCQFNNSPLDYGDIISLRKDYANGVYWENAYERYKEFYPDKWTFWNIYYGNRFKLVCPEVFTKENRKKHSSLSKIGERNGRAKLTEQDIKKIRELHNQRISNKEIYNLYPQVTTTSIRDIINYKTWKHIL